MLSCGVSRRPDFLVELSGFEPPTLQYRHPRVDDCAAACNDGIIIGASSLEHLRQNLTAVTQGPLSAEVLAAIDDAALQAQAKWPPYFFGN